SIARRPHRPCSTGWSSPPRRSSSIRREAARHVILSVAQRAKNLALEILHCEIPPSLRSEPPAAPRNDMCDEHAVSQGSERALLRYESNRKLKGSPLRHHRPGGPLRRADRERNFWSARHRRPASPEEGFEGARTE